MHCTEEGEKTMGSIIDGKIEIMTKISSLPEPETDEKAKTKFFKISNGSFKICVTLPEKMWKRIPEGAAKFESWVCAIGGKIKRIEGNEIYIEEPAVQVFENQKKPKADLPQQQKKQPNQNNNQIKKELEIKTV